MDIENSSCHKWLIKGLDTEGKLKLTDVNNRIFARYIGGFAFVTVLIVIGLVGNLHVLYIYGRVFRRQSNYRIFVIFLSILDIFNLGITAPMVLYYLLHTLDFPSDIFCKLFRFLMYFANVSSTSALLGIAIERRRKTITPLRKNMKSRDTKIMCSVTLVVALLFSWPTPILYGVRKVPTGFKDLYGYRCLADADINPTFITAFLICQSSFFFVVSTSLCITYGHIGLNIHKYGHEKRKSIRSESEAEAFNGKISKSTYTLVIVTLIYICSSLPHHILAPLYFLIENFDCNLTLLQGIAYYTFVFSCFVNNAVNPFIYGFRDKQFLQEMKKLYGFKH